MSIHTSQLLITHCREPFLTPQLNKYILDHDCFGFALTTLLAHKFCGEIRAESWERLIHETSSKAYESEGPTVAEMCFMDLYAIKRRDPACDNLVTAFLHFKGFKALASHRMAHVLWREGRKDAALAIQSRCSELFAVDIHPAARIGTGITCTGHFLNHS